jgi:hypothetical protein
MVNNAMMRRNSTNTMLRVYLMVAKEKRQRSVGLKRRAESAQTSPVGG